MIEAARCHVERLNLTLTAMRHWVKPRLVAEVRFVEWTAEGRLRHSVLLGLRTDKRARDVHREE